MSGEIAEIAPRHHGYHWWRVTDHSPAREPLSERHPYEFVVLLALLIIIASVWLGSLSELLSYPALAVCAFWLITKKRWWRVVGFGYPKGNARSLLLFVPVFALAFWWPFLAPLTGYGHLKVPSAVGLYAVLMLLVGFVEEVYFRGLMLEPLRSKGAWHAVIITSVLFGVLHGLNGIFGASAVYTALQVGYAFGLGLVFGALVLVTRLIWPVILAHGLVNFTSTLNSAAGSTSTTVRAADYWLTGGLLLFGAAYAAVLLRRTPQLSPNSPKDSPCPLSRHPGSQSAPRAYRDGHRASATGSAARSSPPPASAPPSGLSLPSSATQTM